MIPSLSNLLNGNAAVVNHNGLRIARLVRGIINIVGRDGVSIGGESLTPDDMADIRTTMDEAGYEEVRSWFAAQGVSWLSDGCRSVSIEYRPKNPNPEPEWFDPAVFQAEVRRAERDF